MVGTFLVKIYLIWFPWKIIFLIILIFIQCLNLLDTGQKRYLYYITTTKIVMVTLKMMMTTTTLTLTFGINFLSFFKFEKNISHGKELFSYYQKCHKTCNFWCMFKIPLANFDEDGNSLLSEAEKKLYQGKCHLCCKEDNTLSN